MKQSIITGGAGFIGSHLAETLLSRGHRVTVLDDESTGSRENLQTVEDHFDFSYVRGDAQDRNVLRELLGDADEVYHLAAAVGVRRVAEAPIESIERNIRPTEVLLSELLRCLERHRPVKLFLASSSEVYGKNGKETWTEDDDLVFGPTMRARWSYGASKAIDEFLALAYWRQYKLPVVVGRFFNVVGPRQTGRYGMVLPSFIDAALDGKPPLVHDDGAQIRCFAHVMDVCQAVADLMNTREAVGQVYNIGSDQPITILELAEQVVHVVNPQLDIEFESYRHAYSDDFEDVRRRVPDLTKLKSTIPYEPRHDLDAVIREVVEWKKSRRGSQVR